MIFQVNLTLPISISEWFVVKLESGVHVYFCSKGRCLFTPLATPLFQAQVQRHPHQMKMHFSIFPSTEKTALTVTSWLYSFSAARPL